MEARMISGNSPKIRKVKLLQRSAVRLNMEGHTTHLLTEPH